jgi:hypothetical protein
MVPPFWESVRGALLGGDLTDPEDDGDPEANINYDAVFLADQENGFGGGESAWNVFDNQVGGGNAKWYCGDDGTTNFPANPIWVQATFSDPVILTHFTLTSGNDTPGPGSGGFGDPRVK